MTNETDHLLWLLAHEPRLSEEEITQAYTKYLPRVGNSFEVDWSTVNRAIIDRFSMAAFKRIKKVAWE